MASATTLNTDIKYNIEGDKSFGLLRTNPKLTSNVKIVVDSNDNIFLSSFSATKHLSSSQFKRFKIDGSGRYSMDVSRFYGSVPMTERFEVMRKFSDISTHNEYSKQFENQYNYGAEFNATKLYDEQYKFLAPIWLNRDIPKNFVIYRVETAKPSNIQNANSYLGQNEKIMDMLANATIVADFDLSINSKIGEYIRGHIEDSTIPSAGLTFNFDTEEACTYRGIDVKYGGFVNKEEYLADDYIRTDDLEINKNQLLTDGFERNGIAFSNILNLEFMFDDTTGEKYKTYRYFGLYADSIKEGNLTLSSVTSDNILYNSATSVYEEVTQFNSLSAALGSIGAASLFMVPNSLDLALPTLNYVKDKKYKLYHIQNKATATNENKINLRIPDLEDFKGYSEKQGTLTIDQEKRSFKSFIKLKIVDVPNNLDRFFIGNRFSMEDDSYNMGSYTIIADSSLNAGQYSGNYFSNQGSLSQIVMAISDVIKNTIDEGRVKVTPIGEHLVIESYVVGEDSNILMFGLHDTNAVEFIEIVTSTKDDMGLNSASGTITFTDWDIHTLRGGAGENQGMFIESSEYGDVAVGDYIKEKDLNSYVEVIDVVKDYNDTHYRVILKKSAVLSNNGDVKLYNKFYAEFGKLRAYDLKDLMFDFHDDEISGLGSLQLDLGFKKYEYHSDDIVRRENPNRFKGLIDNILGPDSVGRISNIYERLKENKIKETAILSRIVPHINTFVRNDSSNIRGNDYVLNVNESMGIDNMSPSIAARQSEFRFMNLEQYTMAQISKLQASIRNIGGLYTLPVKTEKGLYNIDDSLLFSYDNASVDYTNGTGFDGFDSTKAKNTSIDYFSLFENFNGYFNYITSDPAGLPTESGTSEVWEDMKKVNHSDIIRRGTVFSKGVNYKFSEGLDGYRFMNILRYEHSTDENDTLIEVIKNEKWKTLVIFTTIKTITNDIPVHGLTKGHMYSVKDITQYNSAEDLGAILTLSVTTPGSGFTNAGETNLATTSSGIGSGATLDTTLSVPNGQVSAVTINTKGISYKVGDVLSFSDSNSIVNSTCTVTAITTAPSLNTSPSATFNPSIPIAWGNYGNTELSGYTQLPLTLVDTPIKATFDFGGSIWPPISSPGDSFILKASQQSIDAGDARFNSQIVKNSTGSYSFIKFLDPITSTQYAVKILDIIDDSSLLVAGYPVVVTGNFTLTSNYYTAMPGHAHDDFTLTLKYGGENGFKGLFDSICLGQASKRFINNAGITYHTAYSDGTSINKGPRIKLIKPYSVIKISEKRAIGDTEKPSAFAVTAESVGYNIVDKVVKYITRLNRHSGDYNPAVKNIISFDSIYNQHKLKYSAYNNNTLRESIIYGKFNGHGIAFESYKNCIEDYGIIKNFYYHKVNEDTDLDIIKLSESSDKLPLYPLIGEIAIDKTDLNILDSKYTEGFFKRGLVGLENENAKGTKSPEEVKAFMASTVMKVNDIYDIDTFSVAEAHTSLNELNETFEDNLNISSVHFFEDENRIFADFYITDSLRETLIADGILYKFSENIIAADSYGDITTIDDDISEYVKHNIASRYIIDSIDVYFKESKNIKTGFSSDVSQLVGYKKSTSHNLQSFNESEIGFRFIFEKRVGYNYDFKLNIKIKA